MPHPEGCGGGVREMVEKKENVVVAVQQLERTTIALATDLTLQFVIKTVRPRFCKNSNHGKALAMVLSSSDMLSEVHCVEQDVLEIGSIECLYWPTRSNQISGPLSLRDFWSLKIGCLHYAINYSWATSAQPGAFLLACGDESTLYKSEAILRQ